MRRKDLRKKIITIIVIYALFIIVGTVIYFGGPTWCKFFEVFKDLILLWVAIPAAYLSDCFQRRAAFTSALQHLWSNLIESVNQARQFTFENHPTQKVYGETLKELSKSIDEIRGVYCNIPNEKSGLYPFESLKQIRTIISNLGYEKYNACEAEQARHLIDKHWNMLKDSFLSEFETPVPSIVNTPFREQRKYNYWDDNIPWQKAKEKRLN